MSRVDLDRLERVATLARQGTTGEWTWDDGTLIELDHEDPVGIVVTQASGTPVAPHISTADPATVLALVAELRAAREVVEAAKHTASSPWPRTAIAEMRQALAAYDRHAQPGDDPGSVAPRKEREQ